MSAPDKAVPTVRSRANAVTISGRPGLPTPSMAAIVLRAVLTLVILTSGLLASGCPLPKGDTSSAEALHYAVIKARQSADLDTLWSLLHPETRERFDAWVKAEREIATIVPKQFPAKVRGPALSVLSVQAFANGKALFGSIVTKDASGPLGTWAELGARVQGVDVVGDSATVQTWGGNGLTARRADGKWFALLPEPLESSLTASHKQALANLERVKEFAARLKR